MSLSLSLPCWERPTISDLMIFYHRNNKKPADRSPQAKVSYYRPYRAIVGEHFSIYQVRVAPDGLYFLIEKYLR